MSDIVAYEAVAALVVGAAETRVTFNAPSKAEAGSQDFVASMYALETIEFYAKNLGGANAMSLAVYGLMRATDLVADGILMATATVIAFGATGHVTVGPVLGTANVVNSFPYYACTVISASGTTATVRAIKKGLR